MVSCGPKAWAPVGGTHYEHANRLVIVEHMHESARLQILLPILRTPVHGLTLLGDTVGC